MKASIEGGDIDKPPYGPGYGKNPRIAKITQEDRENRRKEEEELKLNTTSFYDSNKSTIEDKANQEEDHEAEEL